MNNREQDWYYGTDSEQNDYDEIMEHSNQVIRQMEMMGIKDGQDRQLVAKLLCNSYDTYCEANELADWLGLEEKNILCFLRTEESMKKYRKLLESEEASNYYND